MDTDSVVGLAILAGVGIMARSFNGTTDVITTGFSFVQPPFSLAVWFNSTTVTPVQAMIGSNIAQAVEFRLNATVLEFVSSGIAVIGSSSATFAANTWYRGVATYASGGVGRYMQPGQVHLRERWSKRLPIRHCRLATKPIFLSHGVGLWPMWQCGMLFFWLRKQQVWYKEPGLSPSGLSL